MRAITFERHGDPSVLTVATLPEPEPGPGEVVIEVAACALNRLDLWVRAGLPGVRIALPHVLGSDIAGRVVACGEGVDTAWRDQAVVVNPGLSCGHCESCLSGWDNLCRHYHILGETAPGGYCERIAVPVANLLRKPDGLDMIAAAAVPLTFLTAWQMLVVRTAVRPGDVVLVHAAGSGVGVAAVQIAKLHGARVIALASSEAKCARALELGADAAVCTGDPQWPQAVRAQPGVGKRGVDIVVEHTGKDTWPHSLALARKGGVVVTCGASSGYDASTDLRQVFFRQLQILGSTMGSKALLHRILPLVESGALRPVVDRVFPLAQAELAHRHLDTRTQFGKVVLQVGSDA
ncbi:MAG: zinc-binding dehydrogenase [Deltaproteobacteria bacterium]|nr:zinc-binding dehydrogenase [Deltaproteobacteria bacterium]